MDRSPARGDRLPLTHVLPLLSLSLLGLTAQAPAAAVLYDVGSFVLPEEAATTKLVVGDYDGDGLDDIASLRSGHVDVRFGTADGSPGVETTFAPASSALNLARLPDSDGDGRDELLTLNVAAQLPGMVDFVELWRCTPARTIASWAALPTIQGTLGQLAIGDFDGDGDSDFATMRWDGIYLHVQGAPGSFTSPPRIATVSGGSTGSSQLYAGDFDGNGRVDLLRYEQLSGPGYSLTTVLFTGPETDYTEATLGGRPSDLQAGVVGDFDDDGRDEIAFRRSASIDLYRNLDGAPQIAVSLPVAFGGRLSAGDLDLDGRLDLLADDTQARGVQYLRGAADWVFQAIGGIPTGGEPGAFAWARVKAGEPASPIVANAEGAGVVVLYRTPPFVSPGEMLPAPAGVLQVRSADLDGEGPRDFAVVGTSATVGLYRRGVGDLGWTRTDLPVGGSPRDLCLLDVDVDGTTDLLTLHSSSPPRLEIRAGDGAGGFLAPVSYLTPAFPLRVLPGDYDHDGVTDLLVVAEAPPSARLLRGTGGGQFVAVGDLPLAEAPKDALLRDLDGDGRLDLVVAAGVSLQFYPGVNDAIPFASAQQLPVAGGAVGLAAIDANADGRMDLAVATGVTRPAFLLLRQADDSFSAPVPVRSAAYSRSIEAADFDGDAVQDLLVFSADQPGGLNSGTVQLVRGSASGDFVLAGSLVTQSGPMAIQLGDLTEDGRPDLLVVQRTDPTVLIAANPFQGVVDVPAPSRVSALFSRVAPSPSFGAFGVELTGRPDQSVRVELYDVAGRKVGTPRVTQLGADGRGRLAVDAGGRPGVYFVRSTQGSDVHVTRAVVLP